jgi:hypothetical protein
MISPTKMPAHVWKKWFRAELKKRGQPKREIERGFFCRSCKRHGLHELLCRNPWDVEFA